MAQLRAVPTRGLGFGALLHHGDPELRETLRSVAWPELSFNYLGQLDGAFESDLFSWSDRPLDPGPSISPRKTRPCSIAATAQVSGGQLCTVFDYSDGLHRPETIEALAASFIAALRQIIDHCTGVATPDRAASSGPGRTCPTGRR
jgi:non-ribosomal peptide synthase protein (TIGR01720 family)